ncbi:hypothetical protein D3C80_1636590 [compost metagenome]
MAMAVLTSTASAPSSIALAASEGAPIPASTITGTLLCSTMISRKSIVFKPLLLPIGEPKGMTAAAPADSRCLHKTGSACIYGKMIKPILASASAAFNVSTGSGNKYLGSGCISSLSQLVSRASLAS